MGRNELSCFEQEVKTHSGIVVGLLGHVGRILVYELNTRRYITRLVYVVIVCCGPEWRII
jgi:hypothetical protein